MKQFFAYGVFALLAVGCNSDGGTPTDPSQVNIEFATTDLAVGTGAAAAAGSVVTVRYTGWLYSSAGADSKGQQFDSGTLPPITLGARSVIPGFEQGIAGMRVGGKRRVYIPSSLGYGAQGSGPIPPNAALVFEIELLSLQ